MNQNRNKNKIVMVVTILTLLLSMGMPLLVSGMIQQYSGNMVSSIGTEVTTPLIFRPGMIGRVVVSLIFVFALLYILKRWMKYKKEKEREYDEQVVKPAICQIIPGAQFIRDKCMDPSMLYRCGLVPAYDTYKEQGLIHYQRDGKEYPV